MTTDDVAKVTFFAPHAQVMNRIGGERGWPPTSRSHFDAARGPLGALFVGSPARVTGQDPRNHEIFGFDRFLIQMAIGVLDHLKLMKAIEIFGTKVAPDLPRAVPSSRP